MMEESNCELPPVKKIKLEVDEEDSNEKEEPLVVEEPRKVDNFVSPITDPVLTPEIWDKIFRDLCGDDFLSIINATPEWNQLLGSRKTTELFPKLVSLVLPYLDFKDILSCRQVLRGSKAAVDNLLETSWTSSEQVFNFHHEKPFIFSEIEKINDNYALCSRLEIDKFSESVCLGEKAPSYNPFLTRTLCVDIEVPGDEEEAQILASDHVRMTKFLSRFGTHLWRFNINFYQLFNGVAKLLTYLHRLPNLKILELSGNTVRDMRFFRSKELPPLEQLTHLEVTDFRAHSITSRFIQRYGAQLTTLVVPASWIQFSKIETSAFKVLLPKLKRLRVMNADAAALEKLLGVEWPLEALHLWLDASVTSDKRELLLKTASTFESLSQLELYFEAPPCKYVARESEQDPVLEFPEDQDLTSMEEQSLALAEGVLEQLPKMQKVGISWESGNGVIKIVKTRYDN